VVIFPNKLFFANDFHRRYASETAANSLPRCQEAGSMGSNMQHAQTLAYHSNMRANIKINTPNPQ
jgi:hypothetical protein